MFDEKLRVPISALAPTRNDISAVSDLPRQNRFAKRIPLDQLDPELS